MLYTVNQLPNLVKDGYKELNTGGKGVSVEFEVCSPVDMPTAPRSFSPESVTFGYPGEDNRAIEDVSFYLPPGALCVIVGGNGQVSTNIATCFCI